MRQTTCILVFSLNQRRFSPPSESNRGLMIESQVVLKMLFASLKSAGSGIRTHEANARDLKTRPFDHSGIPAEQVSITFD